MTLDGNSTDDGPYSCPSSASLKYNNINENTNSPPPPQACQVCGKQGGNNDEHNDETIGQRGGQNSRAHRRGLLRCKQCQNVWYCSVDCQRLDWSNGHRQVCRRLSRRRVDVVQNTQLELVQLVSSLSVDQATESYHKSMDEITKKRIQLVENSKKPDKEAAASKWKHQHRVSSSNHQKKNNTTTTAIAQAQAQTFPSTLSSTLSLPPLPPPCWDFYVEDLTRLSCYQIVIVLDNNDDNNDLPSLSSKSDSTATNNNDNNKTSLDITILPPSHEHKNHHGDDDDIDASYVVRIAMQQQQDQRQQQQQKKESTTVKDCNSTTTVVAKNCQKKILQLALPAGIILLLPSNNNNNNNNNMLSIPYTMDTTMNGRQQRQDLISIRLQYTTKQQQQQKQQSPIQNLSPERPPLSLTEKLLTPNEANRLACRACGHFLFFTDDDDHSLHNDNNNHNTNNASSSTPTTTTKLQTTKRILNIQRVLPMPSGRYKDMADYLMCYEGQAVVDFSSSSFNGDVTKSTNNNVTLLQDETIFVLSRVVVEDNDDKVHVDDLDQSNGQDDNDDSFSPVVSFFPSVSRLSIPGYGQVQSDAATSFSWRTSLGDSNNNNKTCFALACNLCCSVVGEAQQEQADEMDESMPEQDDDPVCFTYRFWKHRLVVIPKKHEEEEEEENSEEETHNEKKIQPLLTTTTTGRNILSSTLVFLVQELIRLAETKAIFTLSIFCDKDMVENISSSDDTKKLPHVIVLRLVSWGDSSTCAAMAMVEADEASAPSNNCNDTTHDTASNNDDLETTIIYPLKTWRPMAKVLYEIRNVSDGPDEMFPYPQQGPVTSNKNNDNNVWSMFNQNDWCCPLPTSGQNTWQVQRNATGEEKKVSDNKDSNEQQQKSGAPPLLLPFAQQRQRQVVLESWEWNQVRDDLQESSRIYGKEVVFATYVAKTGREFIHDNGYNDGSNDNIGPQIGLAAVPL